MMIANAYYDLKAKAERLEREGICVVREIGEWRDEEGFSIDWTISRGEDFVKASAFAHAVDKWADTIEGDDMDAVVIYSAENIYEDMQYIIKISPVWL